MNANTYKNVSCKKVNAHLTNRTEGDWISLRKANSGEREEEQRAKSNEQRTTSKVQRC